MKKLKHSLYIFDNFPYVVSISYIHIDGIGSWCAQIEESTVYKEFYRLLSIFFHCSSVLSGVVL